MGTEPKFVEELRAKVEKFLREKKLNYQVKPNGTILVPQGSTVVAVLPTGWGEKDQTIVKLSAPVSMQITKITPELTRFLVEKNNELLFGKFSLDVKNNIIWYEHVLLGNYLDIEELFTALATIALTADKYDEEVSKMSGGKRYVDAEGIVRKPESLAGSLYRGMTISECLYCGMSIQSSVGTPRVSRMTDAPRVSHASRAERVARNACL